MSANGFNWGTFADATSTGFSGTFLASLASLMKTMVNQGVGNLSMCTTLNLGVVADNAEVITKIKYRTPVIVTGIRVYEEGDLGTNLDKFELAVTVNDRIIFPYGAEADQTVVQKAPLDIFNNVDNPYVPMWLVPTSNGLGTFGVNLTSHLGAASTNLYMAVYGYRLTPEWLKLNT